MRSIFLLFLFISTGQVLKAQTAPPPPAACKSTSGTGTMTITGTTSFLLDNLTKFTTSESLSTINIVVESGKPYNVYIAGEITGLAGSSTNTPIPIGTFTALATGQGAGSTVPTTAITLNGNNVYQLLIQGDKTTANTPRTHQLTITRNALNTFTQAPGIHTLYLHFYYCQY